MKNERIIEMIDEYLTEPHSINREWVEALTICRQALKDAEKQNTEIDILIRKNETLKDEVERLRKECGKQSELWSNHFESLFETAKETIKPEAYKEFAKKFEKNIKDVRVTLGQTWEIQNALKKTLKELTDFKE